MQYPVMVPVFLREMQLVEHAPWWHTTACVGAQVCSMALAAVGMQGCGRSWQALQCSPLSDRLQHCHSCCLPCSLPVQVILCVFNYVLLGLSLMRQRSKRGPGGAGAKGGKPAKAPAGSRELRDVQPELIKAQPAASSPLRLRARGL